MTAPAAAGGASSMPWKWRLFLASLVILAISVAPGPTGDFTSAFLHGLGTVGCKVSHTTCVTSTQPLTDQVNPLQQVNTRLYGPAPTDDYGPGATVLRQP